MTYSKKNSLSGIRSAENCKGAERILPFKRPIIYHRANVVSIDVDLSKGKSGVLLCFPATSLSSKAFSWGDVSSYQEHEQGGHNSEEAGKYLIFLPL